MSGFLSGILAASMSSADSYMLIASSAIARNLFGGLLTKKASDRTIMWIARIAEIWNAGIAAQKSVRTMSRFMVGR